jgi:alkaline phosphatase D
MPITVTVSLSDATSMVRLVKLIAALLFIVILASCTAAAPRDDAALTRIAFGSCIDQARPQAIAQAIQAYRPDLFVFLGDNVYGDIEGGSVDNLLRAYEVQAQNADFALLLGASRVLAIWDDHDYGVNDGGADFALKRQSEALFLDFWKVPPDDPRRARDGIYARSSFGPEGKRVQVILLDTRYFRSPLRPTDEWGARGKERYLPDSSPGKTLLGAAQWRWLEETLQEPADLRIVGSSIQVIAETHGYERWGNLPAERQRLYDLLAGVNDTPTVVISGDRHLGALYRTPLGNSLTLWEVTSSSLNRPWADADEQGPNQLGPIYGGENFGTIEIDWQARRAILAIHDTDGNRVRQDEVIFGD